MDTTDTDGICGVRPGSTISSALLLRGRSLQAWTRQGTALSKCPSAICWFGFSPSSLITIVQVKNFQGLSVCWINSSPVKLDKFQGVSVKKKKGDPSMNSLSCVAALAVSEGPGSFHSLVLFTELHDSNSDQGQCFPSSLWNRLWRPTAYYAPRFQRVRKGSWVCRCCESKF